MKINEKYESIKKNGLSLSEIIFATLGEPHNIKDKTPRVFSIYTDTRGDVSGSLFVPLKGENFNGHDFIKKAFDNGALCSLTEEKISTDKPYILVKNTLKAYGDIAAYYKRKFDVLTVGITGSVGKTTTKEAVCAVLSQKYPVLKTKENHNNEVGLPQTILSLTSFHRAAVIEMGMVAEGEISYLSKITAPDISVITNIGSSHIGSLGSRENILKAKCEIVHGMKKNGILLLNGDDEMLSRVKDTKQMRLYVGTDNEKCDFGAKNIKITSDGVSFDLWFDGALAKDMFFPSLGRHSVYAALFACACGILCGLNNDEIRRGLSSYIPVDLRQKITMSGGIRKIEDCYNASPESMRASIDTLKYLNVSNNRRAVAVLGEMKELGSFAPEMHDNVGKYAAKMCDAVFLFGGGDNISFMKKGAEAEGKTPIMLGEDIPSAYEILKENIDNGDTVLFKASRAVRLERLSELL